jgi:hypothetical protein
MKMGETVVYRYQNTVRVGRWTGITKNHRAIIMSLQKGNTAFLIRNMNQIYSLPDLVNKYGLGATEMTVEQQNELKWSGVAKRCGENQKRP